jgi:arylsulfatase A-like enzyme
MPRLPRSLGPRYAALAVVAALVTTVAATLLGCPAARPPVTPRASGTRARDATTRGWPRPAPLVVVVVYDQLGTATLERHLPHLAPDGLIRSTMAAGSTVWNARYPYAATYTAPGHAAIFTGAAPERSGIAANKVWDRARGKRISAVDDATHPVIGREGAFASPENLRVSTVGDVLRAATADRAHVVALSLKDRSAVLPGGRRAELALWFDREARAFTTSTYYAPAVPAWVGAFAAAHPLDPSTVAWEPADPALLARVLGPDDAAGEGDWEGYGRTFPHRPGASRDPWEALLATPMAGEALLALATESARVLALGDDATPDLLAISLSNVDHVGHTFGPDSWEYLDNLVRTDRAAGAFVRALAARREVSVLITADHGAAPLAERASGTAREGARLLPAMLAERAEAACDAALGPGTWVDAFVQPFVYLSETAEQPAHRDRAVAAVRTALAALPGVHSVRDVRDAERLRASTVPLERAVGLSLPPQPPGELFLVPAEGSVIDEEVPAGAGTSHGSPWDYDTHVPVVFAGPGVAHTTSRDVVDQRRVAATIAGLLGIAAEWAEQCASESRPAETPLPGAPGLPELHGEVLGSHP